MYVCNLYFFLPVSIVKANVDENVANNVHKDPSNSDISLLNYLCKTYESYFKYKVIQY